jgi:TRAP-type C4-dicarboxylate transport system substrate-binding protein
MGFQTMNDRQFHPAALGFAAAALLASSLVSAAQELPKVHLKVMGGASFNAQFRELEKPFWEEEITERSGGQITAEITPVNELGLKGTEILRLMNVGVLDFATPILGYVAPDEPLSAAADLAGLSPNVEIARQVSEIWLPVLDKAYQEKHGIKLLGIWPYPAQVVFCKTEFQQLSDLQGFKIRTGNSSLAEFVEAIGATPVTMPIGEVVPSLDRGVVDCAITGTLPGYDFKWYEVTNYVYALPLGWSQMVQAVNLKTWNRLGPEVQEFLAEQIADLADRAWNRTEYETEQGFLCLTGSDECAFGEPADMTMIEISPDDEVFLKQALVDRIIPAWIERCGEHCAEEWNKTIGELRGLKVE